MGYATLHDYLARMDAILSHSEPALAGSAPRDTRHLQGSRDEMAVLMEEYQRFAHREIFAPMLAGVRSADAGVREIKIACITFSEEFRSFTDFWALDDVTWRWAEYQPAAASMITRLRAHIERVRAAAWAAGHVPALPARSAAAA